VLQLGILGILDLDDRLDPPDAWVDKDSVDPGRVDPNLFILFLRISFASNAFEELVEISLLSSEAPMARGG
jgi:hypothetical protein